MPGKKPHLMLPPPETFRFTEEELCGAAELIAAAASQMGASAAEAGSAAAAAGKAARRLSEALAKAQETLDPDVGVSLRRFEMLREVPDGDED